MACSHCFVYVWSDPKALCEQLNRWCESLVLTVAKSRLKLYSFSPENLVQVKEIIADTMKSEEVHTLFVSFHPF